MSIGNTATCSQVDQTRLSPDMDVRVSMDSRSRLSGHYHGVVVGFARNVLELCAPLPLRQGAQE